MLSRNVACAALFFVMTANAATIDVPVWSQDFETAATYAAELHSGKIACALLGQTASAPGPLVYEVRDYSWDTSNADCDCIISPEKRIRYANNSAIEESTYMRGYWSRRKSRNVDLMFILPETAVASVRESGNYRLEFDYYLAPSFSNNNTATNGLVVANSDGVARAVFCTEPRSNSNYPADQGKLFAGDSPSSLLAGNIRVGTRGSYDTNGLWMHITIQASDAGVFMDVTQERGVSIVSNARLCDAFEIIDRLYLHAHSGYYSAAVCIDDVVLSRTVDIPDGPLTLVWTNEGGDGKWGNAANWAVNGISGAMTPEADDTVVFPSDGAPWAVELDSNVAVTNFVADGAVSISGGRQLTCSSFEGGKMTLAGVTIHAAGRDVTINGDLEIAAGTENYIKLASGGGYYDCHLNGNMTGTGYLDVQIDAKNGADRGMKFHGDNTAFAGTFASSIYYARGGTAFDSAACSSANAVWLFDNSSPRENTETYLFNSTTNTYRFGAFQGRMKSGGGRRKVEFGGRGNVQTIVTLSNRHTRDNIKQGGFEVTKVGYGPATFLTDTENGSPDNDAIESLDIRGGAVLLGSPAQMQSLSFTGEGGMLGIAGNVTLDPSAFIKSSTAPICFRNVAGEVHVWAAALDASNSGGLLKLGDGTLKLAKPPRYSGKTIVREGTLIVPDDTVFADGVEVADGASLIYAAPEYIWTGAGGDALWENPDNWAADGESALAAPGARDCAIFPSAGAPWAVTLDSASCAKSCVADGAVSFSGGGRLACSSFTGAGRLSLAGVTILAAGDDVVISNDLEIAAATTNFIKLASGRDYWDCHLYGNMTGEGFIDVQIDEGKDKGMKFHGDNTAFAGTFASSIYYARNGTSFDSAACSSTNAVWLFDNNSPTNPMESLLFTSTTDTYRFGAFQGEMKSGDSRRKVEFGARADVPTFALLRNRHDQNGARVGGFDVTKTGGGYAAFTSGTAGGAPDTDAIETLAIQGGAVMLENATPMSSLSFTGSGGVLLLGSDGLDPSGVLKYSTAPICFDDLGVNHTWKSTIDASNSGGFIKRGAGTLILARSPKFTGATRIEGGKLIVPVGTTFYDLQIADGASVEYVEPTPFIWTNASGDRKWSNAANWSFGGIDGVSAPENEDIVVFPSDGAPWAVVMDREATVAKFVANGAVSLTGAFIYTGRVEGKGTITLAGDVGFRGYGYLGAVLDISANLHVTGRNNRLEVYGQNTNGASGGSTMHFSGSVTGDGEISIAGMRSEINITGRWLDFAGTVNIENDGISRNDTRLISSVASSPYAVWNIYNSNKGYILRTGNDRYHFGALNGYVFITSNSYNSWLVVGELDLDCSFGGTIGASQQNHIEKVGAGKLTFTGSQLGKVNIHEGVFVFGGENSMAKSEIAFTGDGMFAVDAFAANTTDFLDPSPFLKNSVDAPICFSNSVGQTHVWLTAIDASNTAGFIKRGQGTLVLASPPLYQGETTVKEGRLVVSNATAGAVALIPGPATCMTIDQYGSAIMEPPPPNAVALAGVTPYDDFASALSACLENPALTLTLLATAHDIAIPFGASIRIRPGSQEYSFRTDAFCRIDEAWDYRRDTVVCSHVLDVVTVEAPTAPNAILRSADTNGVSVAASGGLYRVIRGARLDFTWDAAANYILNTNAVSIVASEDFNAVPAESLPFAMYWPNISAGGPILNLTEQDAIVDAPSALNTLSVNAVCSLRLSAPLTVSNVVFTAYARLTIIPDGDFADGDTLIRWQTPHSLDGFALSDGATANGWMLRAEHDGLKIYKAGRCSVNGRQFSSMEDAFASSSDGDTVRLEQDSWIFERIDLPNGESRTLDLGGSLLKSAPVWAINVGNANLAVSNGTMLCNSCGFYVADGTLSLSSCNIEAMRRVAQIRGAGALDIAPDATLATSSDDPVVFAVGCGRGKASVVSRGRLIQLYDAEGGVSDSAYCIAGNSTDTFGSNLTLESGSAVYSTSAASACIYHPVFEGGDVKIYGGWFRLAPAPEWIAADLALKEERMNGIDGWRVYLATPASQDDEDFAAVLTQFADPSLVANIETPEDFRDFNEWIDANSSRDAITNSPFAWTAFALDAPALVARMENFKKDDVQIADFSPSSADGDGAFSLVVGIKDVDIGDGADVRRLVKVFGIKGTASLTSAFSGDNITLKSEGGKPGMVENGKFRLTAKPSPACDSTQTFFIRIDLNN